MTTYVVYLLLMNSLKAIHAPMVWVACKWFFFTWLFSVTVIKSIMLDSLQVVVFSDGMGARAQWECDVRPRCAAVTDIIVLLAEFISYI